MTYKQFICSAAILQAYMDEDTRFSHPEKQEDRYELFGVKLFSELGFDLDKEINPEEE